MSDCGRFSAELRSTWGGPFEYAHDQSGSGILAPPAVAGWPRWFLCGATQTSRCWKRERLALSRRVIAFVHRPRLPQFDFVAIGIEEPRECAVLVGIRALQDFDAVSP